MSGDGEPSTDSGPTVDRRSVMKTLGAGVALPGGAFADTEGLLESGNATESATMTTMAANLESTLLDEMGWILPHRDFVKVPTSESWGPAHTAIKTQHLVAYLGAHWVDYGDPADNDGGCWKHTFMLNSLIAGLYVDPNDEVSVDEHVTKTYFEIDTDEDDGNENDVDPDPDSDFLAVSVRRDSDLIGFAEQFATREMLEQQIEVEDPENGNVQKVLKEVFAEQPTDTERLTYEDYVELWNSIRVDAEDVDALVGAVGQLLLFGFGLAVSAVCPTCSVIFAIGKVAVEWLDDTSFEQPTEFDEGIRREYDIVDGAPDAAGTGHFVMFDVYVSPGHDGTFTVKSHHRVGDGSHANDQNIAVPNFTNEDARKEYNFNPMPTWEFEVSGPPEGTTGDDVLTARPKRKSESDITTAPANLVRERTNTPPNGEFTMTPELPTPGDEVTFDASDSSDPDGDMLTYGWTVEALDPYPHQISADLDGERDSRTFEEGTYVVELSVGDGRDGYDTVTHSFEVKDRNVEEALAGSDGVATEEDVDDAMDLWESEDEVPGTVGKTVTSEKIQELLKQYNDATGTGGDSQ